MARRPSEVALDPDDPWKDDDLKRQPLGASLTAFIQATQGPFVMSIQGSWGSGKSTFLRRVAIHLERTARIPVISVDAWATDYLQDPLIAYIGAIRKRLEVGQDAKGIAVAKKLASGLLKNGTKLASSLLPIAAHFVVPGSAELAKHVGTLATKIGEQFLAFQDEHEKSQANFSKLLVDARNVLTGHVAEQREIAPIVFVIDELDRCRPEFAVSALERIKHFFDVPGIIFLIATDAQNVTAAINSVYGSSMDSEAYLRKFIEFEFNLPEPSPEDFVRYLLRESGLLEEIQGAPSLEELLEQRRTFGNNYLNSPERRPFDIADVVALFPKTARAFDLPLRDQIRAFTIISCIIRSTPRKEPCVALLLCFGACLRIRYADFFRELAEGKSSLQGILNALGARTLTPKLREFLAGPEGMTLTLLASALTNPNRLERISIIRHAMKSHEANSSTSMNALEMQRVIASMNYVSDQDGREICRRLFFSVELFAPPATTLNLALA